MAVPAWFEVAERVFVQQHHNLMMNRGLVVGDEECLVIDTGPGDSEGRELAESVRGMTTLPWRVATTHGHYDHSLGVAPFGSCPVYAHHRMPAAFAHWLEHERDDTVRMIRENAGDEFADLVAGATPVMPDRLVTSREVLELGNCSVVLIAVGPGHTDHDLVVAVPSSGVVFWGDLVEEGADPDFEGSHPLEWGRVVSDLLDSVEVGLARINVPGHGSIMTRERVEEQAVALMRLGALLGDGLDRGVGVEALVARTRPSGFGEAALEAAARAALARSG